MKVLTAFAAIRAKRKTLGAIILTLLVLSVLVPMFLAFAYFQDCVLEGDAFAGNVCDRCPFTSVTLTGGNILLAVPCHGGKVGDLVGTYSPDGTEVVVLTGAEPVVFTTTRDHIGLNLTIPGRTNGRTMFMMNWKLYIHGTTAQIKRFKYWLFP